MISQAVDEYLRAVLFLTSKGNGKYAKTTEIAKLLDVYPSSVTEMINKLERQGFVENNPYHGSKLTSKGLETAKKILRRYRVLQVFFHKYLGLPGRQASDQARVIEPYLSEEAEKKLCAMLGRPLANFENEKIEKCEKKISCQNCIQSSGFGKGHK